MDQIRRVEDVEDDGGVHGRFVWVAYCPRQQEEMLSEAVGGTLGCWRCERRHPWVRRQVPPSTPDCTPKRE